MKNRFSKYSLNVLLVGILTAMILAAVACQQVDPIVYVTTSAHSTSSDTPEAVTTTLPDITTIAPTTTTLAPVTTTPAPVTTTPAPVTTTPAPATTTPAPVTTTPAPQTSTTAPVIDDTPIQADNEILQNAIQAAADKYDATAIQVAVISDGKVSAAG